MQRNTNNTTIRQTTSWWNKYHTRHEKRGNTTSTRRCGTQLNRCLSWQYDNCKPPTLTNRHWLVSSSSDNDCRIVTQNDRASGQHVPVSKNTVPFLSSQLPIKYSYGPIKLRYANRLMTSNYWQTKLTLRNNIIRNHRPTKSLNVPRRVLDSAATKQFPKSLRAGHIITVY